jgi:hypothetical protein
MMAATDTENHIKTSRNSPKEAVSEKAGITNLIFFSPHGIGSGFM